ncbi:response regulator [Aeoliella sp.]|uniref:response regulator n=1 Tax=Aeoliella sp. TaxID=2795800 RepID=UPI003CCBEDFD
MRLTRKAFENDRVLIRLHRVEDGIQAMQFLRREGDFADAPRPDLILLDLNMPRKSGREVLKEIKEDPQLHSIPVVVLTTSDDEKDVARSYEHQANSYVTKPVDLDQFREVLKTLKDYWFSVVRLPPAD